LLLVNQEDIKAVQFFAASCKPQLRLWIYAHSIDQIKRDAPTKIIDAVLPKQLS